ncbi:uncharacterized protein V2V93DRAFT_370664, partial [Kockiozyma suomiensis]|uniref:uncharacterized protein n=1 Tax=Kockiozyma suomiensis TaxID=1337062 RepID=UPI003342EC6E
CTMRSNSLLVLFPCEFLYSLICTLSILFICFFCLCVLCCVMLSSCTLSASVLCGILHVY